MPADADALTRAPPGNARAHCVYGTDNFVAGHSRIFNAGHNALDRNCVAVADSASLNFDSD
jgi:hypothetical protein